MLLGNSRASLSHYLAGRKRNSVGVLGMEPNMQKALDNYETLELQIS